VGYETLHVSEGFSNHVHSSEDLGRVDALFVYAETANILFDAAVERSALQLVVPVLSAEHLAMMKALAMKDRPIRAIGDGRDVEYLLTVPGIDRTAIRDYFRKVGLLELFDVIDRESGR